MYSQVSYALQRCKELVLFLYLVVGGIIYFPCKFSLPFFKDMATNSIDNFVLFLSIIFPRFKMGLDAKRIDVR